MNNYGTLTREGKKVYCTITNDDQELKFLVRFAKIYKRHPNPFGGMTKAYVEVYGSGYARTPAEKAKVRASEIRPFYKNGIHFSRGPLVYL